MYKCVVYTFSIVVENSMTNRFMATYQKEVDPKHSEDLLGEPIMPSTANICHQNIQAITLWKTIHK